MLRIFTDYSDTAFSLDDFAFFANRFDWWSNLHSNSPFRYAPFHIEHLASAFRHLRAKHSPAPVKASLEPGNDGVSFCKELSEYTRSVFYLKTSAALIGIIHPVFQQSRYSIIPLIVLKCKRFFLYIY